MKLYRINNLFGSAYISALEYVADYVKKNHNVNFTIKEHASELELIARVLEWKFNENGESVEE